MTTKTTLLDELRHAYELKGDVLAATDADHRLYGLRYKGAYVQAFGSWNKAQKRAGLPAHDWKGGRTKGTPNGQQEPNHAGQQVELSAFEEYLAEKLRREREEIQMLERMMSELHHVRRRVAV